MKCSIFYFVFCLCCSFFELCGLLFMSAFHALMSWICALLASDSSCQASLLQTVFTSFILCRYTLSELISYPDQLQQTSTAKRTNQNANSCNWRQAWENACDWFWLDNKSQSAVKQNDGKGKLL